MRLIIGSPQLIWNRKHTEMKSYTLSLLLVLPCFFVQAQEFAWVRELGGIGEDYGLSMDVDGFSDVVTTGYFTGKADFQPGIDTFNLTSAGKKDIFVSKLGTDGHYVWAKRMGGLQDEECMAVVINPNTHDIYLSGYFRGMVDFNPGAGVFELSPLGSEDIFIVKLDPSGNFQWAKPMGSSIFVQTDPETTTAMDIDDAGNLYLTGFYRASGDFNPGPQINYITALDHTDAFVTKLDGEGNFLWASTLGGIPPTKGYDIAVDQDYNVYSTGIFFGRADFDPGGTTYYIDTVGDRDVYISKLKPDGKFDWAIGIGGTEADDAFGIEVDNSGNVYVTGAFQKTVDFDPGPDEFLLTSKGSSDIFILKLDPEGNFIWAVQMGGTDRDIGRKVAIGEYQNVYISGSFEKTVDMDPGPANFPLKADGQDGFIAKFSPEGEFRWAGKLGGLLTDNATDMHVNPANGSMYTVGTFQGQGDFDPGPLNALSNAVGMTDIFVQKMTQCPTTFGAIQVTTCESFTSPDGEQVWTESGTYLDTINNIIGCDSIIKVELTLLISTSISETVVACDSYTSPDGNEVWTESGIYLDTLPSSMGCDSIIEIELLLFNSAVSSISETACGSYTSPDGQEVWTETGVYIDTVLTKAGCDSMVTVNLTIVNAASATITVTACESYTSPDGEEIWTESGTYMDTMHTQSGCDSMITILLTINQPSSSSLDATICEGGGFESPDGHEVWTIAGTYMDTIPNTGGCDSVVTINLEVLPNQHSTINATVCDQFESPDGEVIWTETGVYMDSLPLPSGCYNIITVNLTINAVNPTISQVVDTLYAFPIDGTSYQWLDCNAGEIDDETGQTFAPPINGNYAVIVSANGCTDTTDCFQFFLSDVSDLGPGFGEKLRLYPNPTSGNVTIELGDTYQEVQVRLIEISGRELSVFNLGSTDRAELYLDIPQGIYFIELQTREGNSARLKLIKSKP